MAYNPGITNRSGEILAQGIASAAQTRMQGYQNATNSLLKGFADLSKKQQEDELQIRDATARLSSDPELEKKIRASGNTKLIAQLDRFQTPVTGTMNKFFGSGKGSDAKDIIEYGKGLDIAQAKADSRTLMGYRAADEVRKKTESDRTDSEYKNLQDFRTNVAKQYASGAENLSKYNTFTTDQENRQKNEQAALGNQFISGARNDLSNTPISMVSGIGGKAYAPPPVKQFDTLPNYPQLGNMGMPPPPQMGMPPSQIAMPRSVPQLNQPQSPLGYQTPEEISQMVYDYTPGSNSAQQRIRAYGNMLTPQLMQGENTIEASRDRATALDARAKAVAMNAEIRRKENAVRNRQVDARADKQLDLSIEADKRATRAEQTAMANAARPPLRDLIAKSLGAEKIRETDAMNREIANNPRAVQYLDALAGNFGKVPEQHKAAVEEILNDPTLTQSARDFLRSQIRK